MLPNGLGNERTVRLKAEEHGSDGSQTKHLGALLLPFQIGLLDPANKVAILSFFTSVTVLIALFANPLAGALSDRTASRFGRRRPWILVGGLLTAVGLLFMWQASTRISAGPG